MTLFKNMVALGALALALLAPPTFAWERTETLVHDGEPRSYLLHVPDRLGPGRHALVLVFHGGGGNAENAARMTGMSALAEREGFIVAYPNGSGRAGMFTWNVGNCCGYALDHKVDDVGFVNVLIDHLVANQRVDPRRVYVTGMSNGGMMSYLVGCELAEKVAAIAPVAGAMDGTCQAATPVSVIVFHGTADQHVLYLGGEPVVNRDRHPRTDRPVMESVGYWAQRDNCTRHETTSLTSTVTQDVWTSCGNGTEVQLYTLQDFGHAWPGGKRGSPWGDNPAADINASETMWNFFRDKRGVSRIPR